jgi:hypothetical protein
MLQQAAAMATKVLVLETFSGMGQITRLRRNVQNLSEKRLPHRQSQSSHSLPSHPEIVANPQDSQAASKA